MGQKTCIIICGPTASGKTPLSVKLAQHFNTSIISADSRQCFRELNIGVARPSEAELAAVKHYFIASHSIHDEMNAAVFEQYALEAAGDIFSSNDVAVMAGGTGLYINAFCNGMDDIPAVPQKISDELEQQYKEKGIAWLQEEMQQHDPQYFSGGEMHNPHRLLRALGVKLSSGTSIREYQKGNNAERPFRIIKAGLDIPRSILYERINHRVDMMMEAGLLKEAEQLYPYRHLKALQTVGYAELFDHFDNKHSLETAVTLIKQHTRHYAKRQMTWFRKDASIQWKEQWTVNEIQGLI